METKIKLSSPHLSGCEFKFIEEALIKNQLSNYGENVTAFEESLETYLGKNKKVACLFSGTAAIHLALIQLGVSQGDEVLCQSFTFSASANPITYLGATPIFVDSELTTWNISPEYLEKAIKSRIAKGKKPKAIVAVHLYGMPYLIDEIHAVASKYEIPIVEDSAEALGSTYKGRKCGTFGDFGVLSFNGNKIITTSGGGALICSSKKVKEHTVFLATQARDNAPHYQHSTIGYNYRLSNISAGIGRGQMVVLERHIDFRREMHVFYKTIFKDILGITVFEEPGEDYFSNHWLSCITFDSRCKFNRQDFQKAMELANIETRPLWKPMHLQPVFKNYPYYGNNISELLFNTGLCLPSGSNLTKEDRSRIIEVINRLVSN